MALPLPHIDLITSFSPESEGGRAIDAAMMKAEFSFAGELLAGLDRDRITGVVVEFGVGRGKWLACLANHLERLCSDREVWGFDSFEGLPATTESDLDCWHAGQYRADYNTVCQTLRITDRPWVHLRKGWFNNTLRAAQDIGKVAYARIDCDLYQSTVECLDYLTPRLLGGAVLVFDDWTHDPSKGETKACLEWLEKNPGIDLEFIAANSTSHFYFRVRRQAAIGSIPL